MNALSHSFSPPVSGGTSKKTILITISTMVGLGVLCMALAVGAYIYLRRNAGSGSSLEPYVPQRLGRFERILFQHPDWPIPEGASDTLGARYSVELNTVQLRLVSYPSAQQTAAYAQSRVKFYENDGAAIIQRLNMNRNGRIVGEKIVMTQDVGRPDLAGIVIWNNESVVFVALGYPANYVTELTSQMPF